MIYESWKKKYSTIRANSLREERSTTEKVEQSSFHLTHGRDPRIHVDYDVINGPMKESIVAIRLKKKKKKKEFDSRKEREGEGREH